jgi:hypothetical protein
MEIYIKMLEIGDKIRIRSNGKDEIGTIKGFGFSGRNGISQIHYAECQVRNLKKLWKIETQDIKNEDIIKKGE